MAAYATPTDLALRWRPLNSDEVSTAAALLDDVSVLIRNVCPDVDDRIEDGVLDAGIPKMISVRAVKRSMMAASTGLDGMSQLSETAGPFQHSATFQNPMGDLYLTRRDEKLLGCGGLRGFTIDLAPDASWRGVPPDDWV